MVDARLTVQVRTRLSLPARARSHRSRAWASAQLRLDIGIQRERRDRGVAVRPNASYAGVKRTRLETAGVIPAGRAARVDGVETVSGGGPARAAPAGPLGWAPDTALTALRATESGAEPDATAGSTALTSA